MYDLRRVPARSLLIVFVAMACLGTDAGSIFEIDSEPEGFVSSPEYGESPKDSLDRGERTVISSIPWDPESLDSSRVIYGADDRIDHYQESNPVRLQQAASTCGLFSNSRVFDNGNGTFTLITSAYAPGGTAVCPSEPFANQPTAAFCTGFLVGPDLVATAGHCYDSGDISSVSFVFGFRMLDATTPALTLNNSRLYTGVEVVGRQLSGSGNNRLDYSIIRLDRVVTSPGAAPLAIRRSGTIANGAQVGVIGHPSGLPQKLAFGAQTVVRDNVPAGFFRANLDTYGGNSGSPVFNASTGDVEGILVRGAPDFVLDGSCLVSNVLPDSSTGEDVSKSTTFDQFVPELANSEGSISLDKDTYGCPDTLGITVTDSDLAGTVNIIVSTSGGDSETVTLSELGTGTGLFTGTLPISESAVSTENANLDISDGDTITATYNDADDGTANPAVVMDTAVVDCSVPPDYFTEQFGPPALDLDNTTLTFVPDASNDFYSLCATAATQFPTNAAGGSPLTLGDDTYQKVFLTGGKMVSLYGTNYASFYVGSNGNITFSIGDDSFIESLSGHFFQPRISVLFDDFNPFAGGTISWKQLADRVAVSYENVPEYGTINQNSFQLELFFDGTITITHLAVAATDGLVGLSEGLGVPPGFIESDLSANTICSLGVVWVDFSYPGAELGTQSNPFDTLGEALDVVAVSGTVRILPGSTLEAFPGSSAISSAVDLVNDNPGSGSVFIGGSGSRAQSRGPSGAKSGFVSRRR